MGKISYNDHLDDMMERLMDEDISEQELELEIKRAKALCLIAEKKIAHEKNVINAVRVMSDGLIDKSDLKLVIGEHNE